jgi:hypothetical protein
MWHLADSIRRIRPWAVGAAILSILPLLVEASPLRQVTWEDLPMVVGKTVQIALPGGAVVTGMAAGVELDALVINVMKTSDRRACPKGELRVPRATLHTLKVRTNSRTWVVGMALGSMVMGPVAGAMGSAAAYGAGRLVGHWRWRRIEILP